MLDAEAHSGTRHRAIERTWDAVDAGEIEHSQAREMLKRLAWSRSTYWTTRNAAIDALLQDTDHLDDTKAMFALLVPTERVVEVLDHIGQHAVARGWTNVTPSYVRTWDRNTREVRIDDDRPEPRILRQLHPDRSLSETLFRVFAGDYQNEAGVRFGEADRRAAWGLLARTADSPQNIRDILARIGELNRDSDPLMWAVAQSSRQLGAIPETAEQVEWVERLLLSPENRDFVETVQSLLPALNTEQREKWRLYHLAGLFWASQHDPGRLQQSRDQLISALRESLSGRVHFTRNRTDTAWQGGESLSEWQSKMVWGDVLLALIAADVAAPSGSHLSSIHREIFSQADQDHADTSTEYGGIVLMSESGTLEFRLFPPRPTNRFGDDRFVASREMIEASDDALFHYHFHAMRHNNAEYAGPSFDDFEYARSQGRACLLLTFVGRDRLNLDFFLPNGVRVDLGTINRP